MARIIVCGYMVRYPVAGNLLAYFPYVLGLHRLGHEVLYLEESGWANACYDPVVRSYGDDPSTGLAAVRKLFAAHDLPVRVVYVDRTSSEVTGATRRELERALDAADLLLNLGGVCWLPELRRCAVRALVDMDPLFTQLGRFGGPELAEHDLHFSYGANLGKPTCAIPTRGFSWIATAPPVVPEMWPSVEPPADAPFTTITHWQAYGSLEHGGRHYGQKSEEFMRFVALASRTPHQLELAVSGIDDASRRELERAGWRLREAADVANAYPSYCAYLASSRGELSVAKHAYVSTRSGWFSDRSVCYLALGRPVVLQDTGFSDWLPVGDGVLPFSTLEEAAEQLERATCDYQQHRAAARALASDVFAAPRVLGRILALALGTRTYPQHGGRHA